MMHNDNEVGQIVKAIEALRDRMDEREEAAEARWEMQLKLMEERLNARIKPIAYFINGNGDPGAKVRLDRQEQFSATIKWVTGAVFLALLGLFIGQIRLVSITDTDRKAATHDGP